MPPKRIANRTLSLLPDFRAFLFHVCTNNLLSGPVTSEFLPATATNFGTGTTSTLNRRHSVCHFPYSTLHNAAAPRWRPAQEAEGQIFSSNLDNTSATWRVPSLRRDKRIRDSMTALLERRNKSRACNRTTSRSRRSLKPETRHAPTHMRQIHHYPLLTSLQALSDLQKSNDQLDEQLKERTRELNEVNVRATRST